MAKDFTHTQTGGVGATPQVGDKPAKSEEIKKPQGRPAKLVDDGSGSDTNGSSTVTTQDNSVNVSAPATPTEMPKIPLASEIPPADEAVEENKIPLVAPLEEDSAQESQFTFNDFYIPEHEQFDEVEFDKSKAQFGVPGNDVMPEGDSSPDIDIFGSKEPDDRIDRVYNYPGQKKEYKVIDGYWHEKTDSTKGWVKSSRGTSFALNDYHTRNGNLKEKAKIPERSYFPQKGGVDYEGIKIYGNPYQEGTVYTVKDNRWYKVDQGGNEWSVVDSDRTINALNKYHGTSVETGTQRMSRAATSMPKSMSEDAPLPTSTRDVQQQLEMAGQEEPPKPLSNIEMVGDILQSRGVELGEDQVDVGVDKTGVANKMYSTGTDALFGTPPRPDRDKYPDEISYNMAVYEWDKKYAPLMPPTTSSVESAEMAKKTIVDDMNTELSRLESQGFGKESSQYQASADEFSKLIAEADNNIENAKRGLETQIESFQNRSSYMQSEQYEIDKKNSPYKKIADIQKKMNAMSYGIYDAEGYSKFTDEQISGNIQIGLIRDDIEREKLRTFVQQDVDAFYADSNMTDSQKAQLKMAQDRAKNLLDKGALPGEAEKIVQETYTFMETTKDINNRLSEAYNRGMDLTDVLLENKKVFLDGNRDMLGEEVASLFESTLAMRDFVSDYIDSGKVTIDPISGSYSISDGVSSAESEYIDGQLSELINNYNVAKNGIYSNNRKLIEEKSQQKKSLEAALAKAERALLNGSAVSNDELKDRISQYKDQIKELGYDIRDLKTGENTFFLNDPNSISLNVSGNATATARQIYQAIPDNITPKDRFDIFYESLMKKNESLAKEYGISESYLDRMGEKARDILDWEFLGATLSPQEIEYYKNEATIQQLAPLYLNNDWGITEESAGFWESWDNSFIKTFAPNTAEAGGFFNETDAARTVAKMMMQTGISEEELASGMTIDRINDRIDIDFLSMENVGNMVGTSSAIMLALVGSNLTTTGALKTSQGVYRLLDRYKGVENVTGAVKDFKRVTDAYSNTLQSTKLGKYFYESAKQGLQFEIAGTLFNQEEELNFMSGMGGAMAGKMFEGIFKNMPPSKVVEWMGGIFGANTEKAVAVMKRFGKELQGVKAMHYRGLGEMPEEFAQELISIYRSELDGRGFWEVVNERYFEGEEGLSNLGQLLVSSYVLGAGMGTIMSSSQNDMWNDLPQNEKEIVEQVAKDVMKDMSVANANSDIAAGRIVDNYEAIESEEKPQAAETKTKEDAIQERKTETMDVDEQARDGEGVVEGGGEVAAQEEKVDQQGVAEERIKAESLDQARELYNQGYRPADGERVNESATLSEIENTWIEGRAVDMVKQSTETAAEEVSIADKIRKLKIGDSMQGAAVSTIIPPKVWDTAVEGLAVTVETVEQAVQNVKNSEWYQNLRNTNPEQADKVDAELANMEAGVKETGVEYKQPKTPTSQYQQLKSKLSTFKQGYAKGIQEGRKLTAEEKKSKVDEISSVQEDLMSYARENLPKKSYNQAEITAMMNKVRNARTPKGVEKALDAIDKKMNEFQEAVRSNTSQRILATFNDPLTKKRGDKKVSKISLEARNELKALSEEVGLDNIQGMAQEELDAVESRIDEIISGGVEKIKAKEFSKREERRVERDVPFRVLASQNKSETGTKTGESEITDFFKGKKGAISYDDQLFTSKSALDEYLSSKDMDYDSLGDVEVIYSGDVSTAQKNYIKNTPKAKRIARAIYDPMQAAARTLESRVMDVYRGSKELRDWSEQNIVEATNKAYINRDNGRRDRLQIIEDKITDLFGSTILGGVPKELVKESGITIGSPKSSTELNNDQAVNIYTMSKVDPSPIYRVGDQLFDSEKKANDQASKSGQEVEIETSEYNPQVLRQISENDSIESGIEKINEINSLVEGDEKLSEFSSFLLNDFYVSAKERYSPTFEDLYDMEMRSGAYVPMTRSIDPDLDTDVSTLLGDAQKSASSAMSNHLKSRYNNGRAKFDFNQGAYTKALEYTNSMEHAASFLPVAESMRNLMNSATKPQIVEKIGRERTAQLENHFNDIISDGGNVMKGVDRTAYKALDTWLKYKVVTTLMLKLGSIPKQATSATHFIGAGIRDGVGPHKVMYQAAKLIPTATGTAKYVLDKNEAEVVREIFNSAFVQDRATGKDLDYEVRKMHNHMNNGKLKNATNTLTKILMQPTIVGDMSGVLMGGVPYTLAQYNNNISNKGMSHEEAMQDAIEKFVRTANETQQSTRRDILSNVQTSAAMRMFFTFKTSQIAAMSRLIKGAKVLSDSDGEYSSKEKGQAAYDMTYYAVAQALFVAVANGTLGMIMGEDDDDEKRAEERKRTAVYNLVMDTISSNAQGLGIPGMMGDFVLNNLRNRDAFNNIPVLDMIEDLTSAESSLLRVLADGGDPTKDVSESEYKNFINVLGLKNINKAWESYNQWGNDEINAWDAIMGRTLEENKETGEKRKYHTGEEREDWLYSKVMDMIYGDIPEPTEPFREGTEERMSGGTPAGSKNLAPTVPTLETEQKLVDRATYGTSNAGYSDVEKPIERKSRTAEEIEKRKAAEESRVSGKLGGRTETRNVSTDSGAQKSDQEIREEKRSSWSQDYLDKFGEMPPENMPISKIMDAVMSGKKE